MEEEQLPSGTAPVRRREPGAGAVPQLALAWLQGVLTAEFTDTPGIQLRPEAGRGTPDVHVAPSGTESAGGWAQPGSRDPLGIALRFAAGEVENALWYREWHLRWRRLRLPLQFDRFVRVLGRADTAEAVVRTLAEHAVDMVGGYTCLLVPPPEAGSARWVPHPLPQRDPRMLPRPVSRVGSARLQEILGRPDGPLAMLAPMLRQAGAESLAYAPFGKGGAIVLVERRRERIFDGNDQQLLGTLASRAAAALRQMPAPRRTEVPVGVHAWPSASDPATAEEVLVHAIAIAERGEPLAVARLRLEGLARVAAEDGEAAVERIERTAAEVLCEASGSLGIPMQQGAGEFLLVLPRLGAGHTHRFVARLQRQLPARVHVRASVAAYGRGDRPHDLLSRVMRTSARAADTGCPRPS